MLTCVESKYCLILDGVIKSSKKCASPPVVKLFVLLYIFCKSTVFRKNDSILQMIIINDQSLKTTNTQNEKTI